LHGAPFDLDIAEQEFKRALAINKEQTGSILKLGEVSLLKGQTKIAEVFFRTVLLSNSKSVEAHYLLGYIKWQAGEKQEALSSFRNAGKYSRTMQIKGVIPAEGDTQKAEARPNLAEGVKGKCFFASYWMALRDLKDEGINSRQMEEEYRKLNRQMVLLTSPAFTE
jgi:tetratricopeptide (TPR) repeat protein